MNAVFQDVGSIPTRSSAKEEVLKTKYYDDIQVDWTDDEYKRLEEVKAAKKEALTSATFTVSPDVKQLAMEYAAQQGMTFSVFVRGIVEDVIKNI